MPGEGVGSGIKGWGWAPLTPVDNSMCCVSVQDASDWDSCSKVLRTSPGSSN